MRLSAALAISLLPILLVASCSGAAPSQPRMTSGTLVFEGDSINYAVFVPSTYDPARALPTLLLLHGAGGNGLSMLNLWRTLAEEKGVLLLAPTLSLTAQQETRVAVLFPALLDAVKARWTIDPLRVYAFGYSAGGYFAFDAATVVSGTFAAAGVFAAIIAPGYEWIAQQPGRKSPIAFYIGDHDQFFTQTPPRGTRDLLTQNGFTVHYVELPNQDHDYPAIADSVNPDAWAFLSKYSLP